MSVIDRVALGAGIALGDCGAEERSPLVGEIAAILEELASEPPRSKRRRRRAGRQREESRIVRARAANSAAG